MSRHNRQHAISTLVRPNRERPVPLGLAGFFVAFIFTAVALSGAVNIFRVASVSYTAVVAAITGVVDLTLVLHYNRVPRSAARVAAPFLAFLAWMFGTLIINGTTRQGVQFLTVEIAFVSALLLASTAHLVTGGHLDIVVARCIRFTTVVLIGLETLGAKQFGGGRGGVMVSLLCLSWFLAEFRLGNRRSGWWSLATLLGIGISLSRTAIIAGLVLFALTMLLVPGKRRIRNAALCVLVVAAGAWAVTSWAPLRDRFTQGDLSASVAGIKINTEGRTQVWDVLWAGVQNEPLIGHGPGSASALSVSLDPAFDNPHNDYLRLLYDFGIVGLVLFAWFATRITRLLRHVRKRSSDFIPAAAGLNAGLAILILMATDNPLDYAFVMIPLGAMFGLGLGTT